MADSRITVQVNADASQLNAELQRANTSIGSMAKGGVSSLGQLGTAVKSVAGAFASLYVLKQIQQIFSDTMRTTIEYGMELSKLSKKTGESTDSLSKLAYAAELKETSIESLGNALKFLNRNVDEANDKQSQSAKSFDKAGISIKDIHGKIKSASEVLLELADTMANKTIPQSQKVKIAMDLMGRSGVDMMPMLAGGRKEIEALMGQAEKLGIVLDKQTIKNIEALDDSMDKTKAGIKGLKISIANDLVPELTLWHTGMQTIIQDYLQWGKLTDETTNKLEKRREQLQAEQKEAEGIIKSLGERNNLSQVELHLLNSTREGYSKNMLAIEEINNFLQDNTEQLKENTKAEKESADAKKKAFEVWQLQQANLEEYANMHDVVNASLNNLMKKQEEEKEQVKDYNTLFGENLQVNKLSEAQQIRLEVALKKASEGLKDTGKTAELTNDEMMNLAVSTAGYLSTLTGGVPKISTFLMAMGSLLKLLGMPGQGGMASGFGSILSMFGFEKGGIAVKSMDKGGIKIKEAQYGIATKETFVKYGEPKTGGELFMPLKDFWKQFHQAMASYDRGGQEVRINMGNFVNLNSPEHQDNIYKVIKPAVTRKANRIL
jgi:hypothetical protein